MWQNIEVRLICFVLLLLIVAPGAQAVAIGVNKASINFNDVMRDGFARATVTVTTDSVEPVTGEVILEGGEAAQWLRFSAMNFTFSRDNQYVLTVDVEPPADARVQSYRVNMSIITSELHRSSGAKIGTTTRASLGVPIHISMTGNEIARCRVGGVEVMDSSEGEPTEVQVNIINTGNVRVDPDVTIEVYDKLRTSTVGTRSGAFGESILPTLTQKGSIMFNMPLARSQYWATVRVPLCDYSGLHTFDVLAPGEVKDEGEFIRIDAPAWVKTGDIIPISAVFRNKGERTVRANFKGTIKNSQEDIVKVIDTQQYLVAPDVTANIETFFNPAQGGQYVVAGKIFYNEKLTLEKSSILNVNGPSIFSGASFNTTAYILIGLAIAILLLLIMIKRKKSRRRF